MTPYELASAKMIEKMGALSVLVGKYQAYPDGDHPDNQGMLPTRIEDALAELYASLAVYVDAANLHASEINAASIVKHMAYVRWISDRTARTDEGECS